MTTIFTIRTATDADRPTLLRFVYELNVFEAAMESNRRVDDTFAAATLDWRQGQAKTGDGVTLLAVDRNGHPIGWTIAFSEPYPPFIRADRSAYGYIAELYVVAPWRGKGVGRGLIEAAKGHFRSRGLIHVMIGSMAKNDAARAAYEHLGFRQTAVEYLMDLD
jgi:GNAT superfamily N-acetyltransferase